MPLPTSSQTTIALLVIYLLYTNQSTASCFLISPFEVIDLNTTNTADFLSDASYWNFSSLVDVSKRTFTCAGFQVIGGYNIIGPAGGSTYGQYYERTYTGLGDHNTIYFSITFFAIDSLDNSDYFEIWADNTGLNSWRQSYTLDSADLCGSAWKDLINIGIYGEFVHSGSSLTLQFILRNNEASTNESYGFRDIHLIMTTKTGALTSGLCAKSTVTFTSGNCDCNQGQYKSSSGACLTCNPLCATCYGSSASMCYACALGAIFNGDTCIICDSSCLVCSGPKANQCTTCYTSMFLSMDNTCVTSSQCTVSALPLIATYNSLGYGVCASPCSTTQFVNYNTSCSPSSSCTNISNLISCQSDCTSPMISSQVGTVKVCSQPCSAPKIYYNTVTKLCQVSCDQPYVSGSDFFGKACLLSINNQDAATIQSIASAGQTVSSATQAGLVAINIATPFSSAAMVLGSLSKLLDYTKYLNISHSERLEYMFTTPAPPLNIINTDALQMSPSLTAKLSVYPAAPAMFDKYGIPASFLVNQWSGIISFAIGFCVVLAVCLITWPILKLKSHQRLQKYSNMLRLAGQSYIFGQIYDSFGDVVISAGIELNCIQFTSSYTDLSFCCVIASLLLCVLVITFHVRFLFRYQKIRRASSSGEQIEEFREKSESLKILFEDFFDLTIMQQFFLVFLSIRNIAYGIILTSLYKQPLTQIILMNCLSIAALFYLWRKKPFRRIVDMIQQTVFEVAILTANISLLIMAVLDVSQGFGSSFVARQRLGDAFIMVNTIVMFLPMISVLPKLAMIVYAVYKAIRRRILGTATVHSAVEQSSQVKTMDIFGLSMNHQQFTKSAQIMPGDDRSQSGLSANISDSDRAKLRWGFNETMLNEKTSAILDEGDQPKFSRHVRDEETNTNTAKTTPHALNQTSERDVHLNLDLGKYFEKPGQTNKKANTSYKKSKKKYIRKVNDAEEEPQMQLWQAGSMLIQNMSSVQNIPSSLPRAPRNQVSQYRGESGLSSFIPRTNTNIGAYSSQMTRTSSLNPEEKSQPILELAEVVNRSDIELPSESRSPLAKKFERKVKASSIVLD